MTQNVAQLDSKKGKVQVCVGWDRPLQEYFCNVQLLDNDDEDDSFSVPLSFPRGLPQVRAVLKQHDLEVPEVLFSFASEDAKKDLGNVMREFAPDGTLLHETVC